MTIELELVALGFFYYRRECFWSKNENLTMTSELNRPTESFSGIQTNASLVGDARECCHPCYTGRRAILARNVTSCEHFARSRLTVSGNRRYKRLIYLMSDPESVSQYNSIVRLVSFIHEVLLFYLPRVKISYRTIP